jgi:hypothetical protein
LGTCAGRAAGARLLCRDLLVFSQAIASQIDQLSQQLRAAAEKFKSIISQSSLGKVLIEHLKPASINPSPITVLQNFFGVASNLVEVVGVR